VAALRRLWRGELPLATAFWRWAVCGGLAVNLTTSVLFLVLLQADRPVEAVVVGYVMSVPYNIVVAVGVWRSADRDPGDPRRAAVLRYATVIGMTALSLT
jgi:hypothetical protein